MAAPEPPSASDRVGTVADGAQKGLPPKICKLRNTEIALPYALPTHLPPEHPESTC